ncbi:MAG: MATE family efflux transporter [Tissierellia bacterium]|nr:MATE family efflux transporter [Tissierellia bacterium]
MNDNINISNPLATDDIRKLIQKFSVPAIISGLVNTLYNIVDQIFIGRSVGMLGNAATNVAFPLTTISISVALLIGIGTASNFSLNLGRKNEDRAANILANGMVLLVIAGLLISGITITFLEPLIRFFGATDKILEYSLIYTGITTLGIPFFVIGIGGSHMIRADGSPKYSMASSLAGAMINIILDPILIFGFNMGMAGAAIATVIGQIASALMVIYYFRDFKSVRLKKDMFKLKGNIIKAIAALGAAACFNQLAMTAVQITKNKTMTHYGGLSHYGSEIPLAVVGIIAKINSIMMAIIIGISQGCQPIFGYNFGAKNYDRVKETYKTAIILVTIISGIAFISFQVFPRQIISIFGEGTEEYFEFGERYFRIFMFMTVINGIQPLSSNFFTSIGKAKLGITMSLTRQIIFLLPLMILLPRFMGIDGILYAGPIADTVTLFLASFLVYREMKEINKLQSELK